MHVSLLDRELEASRPYSAWCKVGCILACVGVAVMGAIRVVDTRSIPSATNKAVHEFTSLQAVHEFTSLQAVVECSNTCNGCDLEGCASIFPSDGDCDDGGLGSTSSYCDYGTDCNDCGTRAATYTQGIGGQTECPAGYTLVTNETDCLSASTVTTVGGTTGSSGSWWCTIGCFLGTDSGNVYYNTAASAGSCSPLYRPICKEDVGAHTPGQTPEPTFGPTIQATSTTTQEGVAAQTPGQTTVGPTPEKTNWMVWLCGVMAIAVLACFAYFIWPGRQRAHAKVDAEVDAEAQSGHVLRADNPAQEMPALPDSATAAKAPKTKARMKIGYIGSPDKLQDAHAKKSIVELFSKLAGDAQIYVGHTNAELQDLVRSVKSQDMMAAVIDMFDAIVITSGGPEAEMQAKRFNTHCKLYIICNSANETGSPKWFTELRSSMTFDLEDFQVDRVKDAILNGGEAEVTSKVEAEAGANAATTAKAKTTAGSPIRTRAGISVGAVMSPTTPPRQAEVNGTSPWTSRTHAVTAVGAVMAPSTLQRQAELNGLTTPAQQAEVTTPSRTSSFTNNTNSPRTPGTPGWSSRSPWSPSYQCGVCNVQLGKRFLRPRHHCRMCGMSVCGNCSGQRMVLEGLPQRICTQCHAAVRRTID